MKDTRRCFLRYALRAWRATPYPIRSARPLYLVVGGAGELHLLYLVGIVVDLKNRGISERVKMSSDVSSLKGQLDNYVDQIEKPLKAGRPVPTAVFLPPASRKGQRKVVAFTSRPPTVDQKLMRIEQEVDPVGLMIAIANGQPVPTYFVDESGEVQTVYETLDLNNKHRQKMIMFLAEKALPRVVQTLKQKSKSEDGTSTWEATIASAASALENEDND